jgi:hypothetical protein
MPRTVTRKGKHTVDISKLNSKKFSNIPQKFRKKKTE